LELTTLSAAQLSKLMASRQVSAIEVAQAHLDAIERRDPELKAFITVTPDEALNQARAAQETIDSGEAGPLTGIPIALKDNLSTEGVLTTCASRILEDYVPPFDATVVSKIKRAGMVILGKTNLDEFAMGTSTETLPSFPPATPSTPRVPPAEVRAAPPLPSVATWRLSPSGATPAAPFANPPPSAASSDSSPPTDASRVTA